MNAEDAVSAIIVSSLALFCLFAFWTVLIFFLSLETLPHDTNNARTKSTPAIKATCREVRTCRTVSA